MPATTSLTLATQKPFGTLTCDFYKNDSGEFYMTRDQVGTALEYSDPRIAITKIHTRNSDRLDPLSTSTKLVTVEGERTVEREMFVYNLRGVMEICRFSRQPKADKFMDFVWDVMESLYNGNSVLAAPDQQTAVTTETFKSLVDTLVQSQQTTKDLVQSFIADQKDARTCMSTMVNTMSLMADRIMAMSSQPQLPAPQQTEAATTPAQDPAPTPAEPAPAQDELIPVIEGEILPDDTYVPHPKQKKHRGTISEWRRNVYDTCARIVANNPEKYTETKEVLTAIYNKMNRDYAFVIDAAKREYRRCHPYTGFRCSVIDAIEDNTTWREIFDPILQDFYNDSLFHCVIKAHSEKAAAQAPAPATTKVVRAVAATSPAPELLAENDALVAAAVQKTAEILHDTTNHNMLTYRNIYKGMHHDWNMLMAQYKDKFGTTVNTRRKLVIASKKLTESFVDTANCLCDDFLKG